MNGELFQKIIQKLDENKIVYQLYEHEPVYTSEEAAKIRNTGLKAGAKAMVCMADKKPVLLVISAAYKIDSKKFKASFRVRDLRFTTPEEVEEITNVTIGAVPPFGSLMGLVTYMDQTLAENEQIAFNAGLHTKSVKMNYEDFIKIEKPTIGDFSQQ